MRYSMTFLGVVVYVILFVSLLQYETLACKSSRVCFCPSLTHL